MLIVDTGVLVAATDRNAPAHEACADLLTSESEPSGRACLWLAPSRVEADHRRYKGDAVTIDPDAAVIQLPKDIRLTGPIGWLGWLALHIVMLLGMRTGSPPCYLGWHYLAWPHGSSLIIGGRSPSQPHEL